MLEDRAGQRRRARRLGQVRRTLKLSLAVVALGTAAYALQTTAGTPVAFASTTWHGTSPSPKGRLTLRMTNLKLARPGQSAGQAGIPVARDTFGVNTFAWDSQILTPGAKDALSTIGVGMQQFPNSVNWDWQTNTAVANPNNPVNPGTSPVSINEWSRILQSTNETGLYIFNYDQAPDWTGGGDAADAMQLATYIRNNNIPVTAIVIGDEEYGQWDFDNNLHSNKSAQAYANNAVGIATAIRSVLPRVKIGVSFEDSASPDGLRWDATVLRTDAPYINFLSVHQYPVSPTATPVQALSELPSEIQLAMGTAYEQIYANLPASEASKLGVWITEFNPENGPLAISYTPAYGAAMLESMLSFAATGAQHVFVWSLDGGQDAPNNAGTFALIANGQVQPFALDQLYPSGTAVERLMQAIGNGASLSAWSGSNGFAATIQGQQSTSFFINTTSSEQTYTYSGGLSVTVPAESYSQVHTSISSVDGMSSYSLSPSSFATESDAQPTISSQINSVYPGQVVTLTGSGFGQKPGYVSLRQGLLEYGMSTNSTVSWSAPGNWYTVDILSWSPTQVQFQVPDNTPASAGKYCGAPATGHPLEVSVVTSVGSISNALNPQVVAQPTAHSMASSAAQVQQPLGVGLSTTNVYPGEWVTASGYAFTNQQGYVQIRSGNVSWGAPGNSYKVNISKWTDGRVMFQIPNGLGDSGQPLPAGTATVQIVSPNGIASLPFQLQVTPYGGTISELSATSVLPGEQVTVTGSGFGRQPGYLQLLQGTTSWGAPGNLYKVQIVSWSDTSVTFNVPDGTNSVGNGISPGATQVRIVSPQGVSTSYVSFRVE